MSTKLAKSAEKIFERCLEALTEIQDAWPMASRWQEALRKLALPINSTTASTEQTNIVENSTLDTVVCS